MRSRNQSSFDKRGVITVVVPLLIFLSSADVNGVDFNSTELKILNSGGIVRREFPRSGDAGFFGGSSWAVLKAPVEEIWAALQDWPAYTKAFPNTVEVTELSRKNGRSLIRMRLGHPVIQVKYHVSMQPDKDKKTLKFKLVKNHPSDIDDVKGYWRLFPLSGGRTLVAYVLGVNVPMGIVNLLSNSFKKMALHGILGAPGHLRKWVERNAGKRYTKK